MPVRDCSFIVVEIVLPDNTRKRCKWVLKGMSVGGVRSSGDGLTAAKVRYRGPSWVGSPTAHQRDDATLNLLMLHSHS